MSLWRQALGLAGLLLILDQNLQSADPGKPRSGRADRPHVLLPWFTPRIGAPPSLAFLAGASGWQRWFFLALAGGFTLWVLRELRALGAEQRALALTYGALLGGALGNTLDRAASGAVTDFLLFIGKTITFRI